MAQKIVELNDPECGTHYIGTVNSKGEKHGQGKLTLPGGSIYEGDFQDDNIHGVGMLTTQDGERYQGDFVNGEFEGHGTYIYEDGSYYIGDWHEGRMHGKGKYRDGPDPIMVNIDTEDILDDGRDKDVGDRKKENLDGGAGQKINSASSLSASLLIPAASLFLGLPNMENWVRSEYADCYEGDYCEDEKHGVGIYTSENGARYEGQWVHGEMCGHGMHVDSKGVIYDGEWVDSKMHGRGKMIAVGGKNVIVGLWKEGSRVDETTGEVLHEGTDPSTAEAKEAMREMQIQKDIAMKDQPSAQKEMEMRDQKKKEKNMQQQLQPGRKSDRVEELNPEDEEFHAAMCKK